MATGLSGRIFICTCTCAQVRKLLLRLVESLELPANPLDQVSAVYFQAHSRKSAAQICKGRSGWLFLAHAAMVLPAAQCMLVWQEPQNTRS